MAELRRIHGAEELRLVIVGSAVVVHEAAEDEALLGHLVQSLAELHQHAEGGMGAGEDWREGGTWWEAVQHILREGGTEAGTGRAAVLHLLREGGTGRAAVLHLRGRQGQGG